MKINIESYRIFFIILTLIFCIKPSHGQEEKSPLVVKEIPTPSGYTQVIYPKGSFSHWIQNLPLTGNKIIHTYNGEIIREGRFNILAVVDMPLLFKENIEQCADYTMRFWAEYHKDTNQLNNLYLFNYDGSKKFFSKSRNSYRNFLRSSFINTNSFSLKAGCRKITDSDIIPGDIIVQNKNGGIGHVSMVINTCISSGNGKLYLIGFSFMPAQEFHIEDAGRYGKDNWFSLSGFFDYLHDNLDFGEPLLRRY